MRSLFRKLSWLMRRRRKEAELEEELRFHLDEEAEEGAAAGLTDEQARLAARRELGNAALTQEDTRAAWGWIFLEQLAQDVRYAFRTMSSNKTFSALAVLSLALGIGANSAIFSFADGILLRSLPVPHPESLVQLGWHTQNREFHGTNRHADSIDAPAGGYTGGFFAYPAFELFRNSGSDFSTVFGYQGAGDLTLSAKGQADRRNAEYVSGEYFGALGVPPAAGRLIAPDDDRAGTPAVAAISFALSARRFGGPANAVGQSVLLNNVPFTIIGVTPPEFFGADPGEAPDIYIPMHANLLLETGDKVMSPAKIYLDPNYEWVVIMARLRPGISAPQAQAALADQFSSWMRTINTKRRRTDLPTLVVKEAAGGLQGLRQKYSKPLYMLLTLVCLILTIACANIANLLLARAAARRREMAVRLSMGAGRFRVIRQLLTESVMLALLGAMLGVGFAAWGVRSLTLLLSSGRENFTLHAELNWHVLAVTAALALLTGVLFGLAPAIQSTRVDLMPALKESRTGATRGHTFRRMSLGGLLMVSQIALTLLILVAAGLFARTLSNLESIQLGFNRENVLTFGIDARQGGHGDPEILDFYNDLRARFASIPGVRNASLSQMPLIGHGGSMTDVSIAGSKRVNSPILCIGPGFFTTMQIPILLGREIDERDRAGAPLVAVVNEAFVKQYLDGQNPLGRRLALPFECPRCAIEIVGVAANAVYADLTGGMQPTVYLPFTMEPWGPVGGMVYELRTAGDPLGYVHAVGEIVHRADARLPVSGVKTQSALIDGTINQEITFARLCGAFALLALAIACVGLYGTMSYNVARRTNEIGIRMALGAQRARVVRMVLREVLVLSAAGLAIGLPAALAASKLVKSFLFGMQPNDPLALTAAILTLAAAAILAGYVPARRASRIDPASALRHE